MREQSTFPPYEVGKPAYLVLDIPDKSLTARALKKQRDSQGKLALPEDIKYPPFVWPQGSNVPFVFTVDCVYLVLSPSLLGRIIL